MIHIIVDYSFLYYKYKFALDSGRMSRLSAEININGQLVERDVSQMYYSLREIESFRKAVEEHGEQPIISICFDMPSERKEEEGEASSKYKSNRKHVLKDEDFENIAIVQSILDTAGYNTYRIEGYEADDIIHHLCKTYTDKFDSVLIVTPDADLMVNITGKIRVQRYKSTKGYSVVGIDNFSSYLEAEMKCKMPYNALTLYKITVGDKSDCIDGIKGFGPKAFNGLVDHLTNMGINWPVCGDADNVEFILNRLEQSGYFPADKLAQARTSLRLVRPRPFHPDIVEPCSISSAEKRKEAYLPYNMKSLVQ